MRRNLSVVELDEEFHDAWVDLDSVEIDEHSGLSLNGFLEQQHTGPGNGRFRTGRFEYSIYIENVTQFRVSDIAGVGTVPIANVTYVQNEGLMIIEGAIPGVIEIVTQCPYAYVEVAETPSFVRRWFRWKPVG